MSRIEDLEGRLAKDPNSKIFAQLAEEYRKAGRLEDAIQTCRDGLENHPNYFSARVALGRALLETDALDEAGQEFETVLAQVPDNILANKFLGRTYEELGRLEEAVAKYRIAQMLAPEDADLAERVQRIEAQLDGVSAGQVPGAPGAVPPPPPTTPVVQDPSAFELEEIDEVAADQPALVPDPSDVEPTLVEEPPTFESPPIDQEASVEPTMVEMPPVPEPPKISEPTLTEEEPRGAGPEAEQVFEFDDSPQEEGKPPSAFVGRQATELSDSAPVSDEARAIQDGFEQSFPTDVMKRQMREIMDSTEGPEASETEPREPFEAPASPPRPVVEEPPSTTLEQGRTRPMSLEEGPQESASPHSPVREMPAESGVPSQAGMSTATLAELYASQGHLEQSLNVYREILAGQPNDSKVRQRVEELTMLVHAQTEAGTGLPAKETSHTGSEGQALRDTIRMLEGWLAAIRKP